MLARAWALDSAALVPCNRGTVAADFSTGPGLHARRAQLPELPDVVAYLTALEPRVLGQPLERLRLASPFVLRSVDPPVAAVEGRTVVGLRRLGKRIVLALEGGCSSSST